VRSEKRDRSTVLLEVWSSERDRTLIPAIALSVLRCSSNRVCCLLSPRLATMRA
jgi:hypothetical protein